MPTQLCGLTDQEPALRPAASARMSVRPLAIMQSSATASAMEPRARFQAVPCRAEYSSRSALAMGLLEH